MCTGIHFHKVTVKRELSVGMWGGGGGRRGWGHHTAVFLFDLSSCLMKMNFDSCENRNVKATILCPAVVVDCFYIALFSTLEQTHCMSGSET